MCDGDDDAVEAGERKRRGPRSTTTTTQYTMMMGHGPLVIYIFAQIALDGACTFFIAPLLGSTTTTTPLALLLPRRCTKHPARRRPFQRTSRHPRRGSPAIPDNSDYYNGRAAIIQNCVCACVAVENCLFYCTQYESCVSRAPNCLRVLLSVAGPPRNKHKLSYITGGPFLI